LNFKDSVDSLHFIYIWAGGTRLVSAVEEYYYKLVVSVFESSGGYDMILVCMMLDDAPDHASSVHIIIIKCPYLLMNYLMIFDR
jgi:hypothetical protein